MKSLPLLVFAAFAACVPGARASDYHTLTEVPDLHRFIVNKLLPKDQALYGAVDRKTRETVRKLGEDMFKFRFKGILKGLNLQIPDATIASVFNRKRGPSAYDQSVSITDIINVIGPNQLLGNAKLTKKLTSLVWTPPGESKLLTTGDANSKIIADPRGLLLLKRKDENKKLKPKDNDKSKSKDEDNYSIDDLFEQNAERFKRGLEIDESWIDNGLLGWFAEGIPSREYRIKIALSHSDVVALLCRSIYSSPTPPDTKAQLTSTETAGILQGMFSLLHGLKQEVSLETLRKLKTGPLKTDPVAFDPRVGLRGCIAQRPSVYALLDSLDLLTDDKNFMRNPHVMSYTENILAMFIMAAGIDAEDLFWMMCKERESTSPFDPFYRAVTIICTDVLDYRYSYVCPKSEYFMNTLGNGVLGWDTLSWVLHKMVERKLYQNAHQVLLMLAKYWLLPAYAHAGSEIFKSAMALLESTKNGTELDTLDKEKLENLLSGKEDKGPYAPEVPKGGFEPFAPDNSVWHQNAQDGTWYKDPQSGKKPEESESGKEGKEPESGKEPKEPRSGKKDKEPRSGKEDKEPRSGKEDKESESGKEPRSGKGRKRPSVKKMVDKFLSKFSTDNKP